MLFDIYIKNTNILLKLILHLDGKETGYYFQIYLPMLTLLFIFLVLTT